MKLSKNGITNPNRAKIDSIMEGQVSIQRKINKFLGDNIERILDSLNDIHPKDRIVMIEKFLKYSNYIPMNVNRLARMKEDLQQQLKKN